MSWTRFLYLREVLPRIREAGYDLNILYDLKANLTRKQVRLLREAGVGRIQPGIESLSTPILRLMRKGVTAFQNVRLLKWCAQHGIRVWWNVIYGVPGEPPEEYARMAEVVPSLTHLQPPTLCPLCVDRFSPYHERPQEFGLELVGPSPWYRLVYSVEPATLTGCGPVSREARTVRLVRPGSPRSHAPSKIDPRPCRALRTRRVCAQRKSDGRVGAR